MATKKTDTPLVEFVKEVPPRSGRGMAKETRALIEALKSNPNQWAKTSLKASTSKSLVANGCEAAVRTVDGKAVLYARFVGKESA